MSSFTHCGQGLLIWLSIGAAIAVAVFALMIHSIIRFDKGSSEPAALLHRTLVEVAWAMIPILILIVAVMPTVQALITIENRCN
jgi:heme/copper-type cytochrome/quinol oxidase subunit 2